MNLTIGNKAPETVNVLIEIPKGEGRNKYEFDKVSGLLKLDRVSRSSVMYPADYGFIPETSGNDGDPLDILVINRFPILAGALAEAKVLGVFKMNDSGEDDEKIIGVAAKDPYYDSWQDILDVPESLRAEIEYFFKTYKELEPGKHIETRGFLGKEKAIELIKKSLTKK